MVRTADPTGLPVLVIGCSDERCQSSILAIKCASKTGNVIVVLDSNVKAAAKQAGRLMLLGLALLALSKIVKLNLECGRLGITILNGDLFCNIYPYDAFAAPRITIELTWPTLALHPPCFITVDRLGLIIINWPWWCSLLLLTLLVVTWLAQVFIRTRVYRKPSRGFPIISDQE